MRTLLDKGSTLNIMALISGKIVFVKLVFLGSVGQKSYRGPKKKLRTFGLQNPKKVAEGVTVGNKFNICFF